MYKQLEISKIKDLRCFESYKTVFKSIKQNLFLPLQHHIAIVLMMSLEFP